MDIIRQAFRLMEAVTGFAGRVRKFYYAVVLLGHCCPKCDGKLRMVERGFAGVGPAILNSILRLLFKDVVFVAVR